MRNITDEQIEKAFENEAETRRRNSAYATAVEKIYHSKQFNIIFGIYLVFCIVFLFSSGGIIRLLKRSVIILLIPIALMAVSLSQAGGRDGNILTKKGYYNDRDNK